jgi:hypothetical protein
MSLADDQVKDDANRNQKKEGDATENHGKAPEQEPAVTGPVWPEMRWMPGMI